MKNIVKDRDPGYNMYPSLLSITNDRGTYISTIPVVRMYPSTLGFYKSKQGSSYIKSLDYFEEGDTSKGSKIEYIEITPYLGDVIADDKLVLNGNGKNFYETTDVPNLRLVQLTNPEKEQGYICSWNNIALFKMVNRYDKVFSIRELNPNLGYNGTQFMGELSVYSVYSYVDPNVPNGLIMKMELYIYD